MERILAKYGDKGDESLASEPKGGENDFDESELDLRTLAADDTAKEAKPAAASNRQRYHRTKGEETAHKIREAFYILTQGVDVMHYKGTGQRSSRVRQVLWLESDTLRICIDSRRLTAADHIQGKTAKVSGLYLRDIAEVRKGTNAFHFKQASVAPPHSHHCLSLIGSERTLCMEMPSKEARDWFYERFKLVLEDILSPEEMRDRRERSQKRSIVTTLTPEENNEASQMLALLKRGIQILHHNKAGRIVRSVVTFDPDKNRVVVSPAELSMFGAFVQTMSGVVANKPVSLHLTDIAEIRLGSHSFGFVATDSTGMGAECMTIVGTEATLDLQLATSNARDLFVQKLRTFIRFWELNIAEEGDDDDDDDDGVGGGNGDTGSAAGPRTAVSGDASDVGTGATAGRSRPASVLESILEKGADDEKSLSGSSVVESLKDHVRENIKLHKM